MNLTTVISNTTNKLKTQYSFEFLVENYILILILLIPVNLSKHFILESSYVAGSFVDYLSPAIFASDFVLLTLLVFLIFLVLRRRRLVVNKTLLVLALLLIVTTALNPSPSGLAAMLRFLVFALTTLFLKNFRAGSYFYKLLPPTISLAVFWQSVWGLSQFTIQRNLCGYLCFGETTLSPLSFGVTKEFFGERQLILPYGTFPHPNVLAGFLSLSLTILLYFFLTSRRKYLIPVLVLGFMTLLLTKSDSAYLVFGIGVVTLLTHFWRQVASDLSFLTVFSLSLTRRFDLSNAALETIRQRPLLGVGTGNFVRSLTETSYSPGWPPFWQPVHNLYLLWAAENGLPFLFVFCFLFFVIFKRLYQIRSFLPLLLLAQVLILSLLDHYFWTTAPGLLMFWLVLGVSQMSPLTKPLKK